jgi:tellurium resistance protein TerD
MNSDSIDPLPEDETPQMYQKEENLIKKGDYFDIRRKIPELKEIVISAGWDHKMFEENPLDVDLSCFLLNKAEQTREDSDFVFYNNDKACEGAVRYMGDSRTGAGDGDDESIIIDLSALPFDVTKIVFTLTIYNALEKGQAFGLVRNLYMRLVNATDDNEICRYKLDLEEFGGQIGIKVAELNREGPKWFLNALGEPISGGLGGIATQYGIIVQM